MTKLRIVVVEDEQVIRDSIAEILRDEGFDVVACVDGQDAIERIAGGPVPSVVLTDIRMPRLGGWELRAWLLAHPRYTSVPVVVMSASRAGAARGDVQGVPVLLKPFDLDDLIALVVRVAHGDTSPGPPLTERDRLELEIAQLTISADVEGVAPDERQTIRDTIHAARNALTRIDLQEQLARRRVS